MESTNIISQSTEAQSMQSLSKTEELELRKKIILNFLKHYKKKSYDHSHITDDFYKKIKKNGITISQLYEIMCRTPSTKRPPTTREITNVNKRVLKPLLDKPVSIDNFKKNVKSLNYLWDSKGYLRTINDDIKFEYAKQLHLYTQQKSSISIYLEEIPYNVIKIEKEKHTANNSTSDNSSGDSTNVNNNGDVTQQNFKYCISIYFKDNLDLDAIASLLYKLFSDSILGVMVGFGMIQVHCKFPNKAKAVTKNIHKIFNDGVYDGYYLFE